MSRSLIGKAEARRLLEALEAPIPGEFEVLGGIADLTPKMFDRPRAIKPQQGSNNRGFLPLVPAGKGTWRDVLHGDILDFDDVRRVLVRELLEHSLEDVWVSEELLRGPDGGIPPDVKILAFRGTIAATFVRTISPKLYRWFDPRWRSIDPGLALHTLDDSIQPPDDAESYLELARSISAAIAVPFVRVDLLATERGPVVGELTPFPGWAHDLAPDFDEKLGRLYEAAETELIQAGMNWDLVVGDDRLRGWQPHAGKGTS